MQVLISGGSGLIGRELVAELLQHGHEPIVLSRSPDQRQSIPRGARLVKWDARTPQGWGHLVNEAGAIVNLAGESLAGTGFFPKRWNDARRKRILNSRLKAGEAIVAAVEAAERKPNVVVQASAIGYYGPLGDKIVTEDHVPGDDFLAKTCVQWEKSTAPVRGMGVRHTIIRSGIVLSTQGGALPRLLFPHKLFVGGPFGNGKQWYSWIHIADEVSAIRFLIENQEAEGVFNLTSPNPLPNAEFSKTLGRVMKRPSLIPVPGFAMKALFGEVSTVVLDGQRVSSNRLQEMGFAFQFPELESAFRDLLELV